MINATRDCSCKIGLFGFYKLHNNIIGESKHKVLCFLYYFYKSLQIPFFFLGFGGLMHDLEKIQDKILWTQA